ncbi:MAG: ATP citrate lyase citrate-binding domain-containing protein [Candidatus Micrarchaeota archaeon]
MARRKLREYDAKRLLAENMKEASDGELQYVSTCVQVAQDTDMDKLGKENAWLKSMKLVVKPDMLFGRRGKNNLILLNASWEEAKKFIREKMNSEVEIRGVKGALTHFLVEPFVPHNEEYYFSILSKRDEDAISFSVAGGMDVEENWEKMVHVTVPTGGEPDAKEIEKGLSNLSEEKRAKTAIFIQSCYRVFRDLDFTLMEFNPFTYDEDGSPFPLDMRGELDDTAEFKDWKKWGKIDFPRPFGRKLYPEEQFVSELDSKSGSSLKLTLLNPEGRIWTMVAGGGASVIYADTIVDLGMGHELANYGEYSGDPNAEETYLYAKTLLDLATRNADGKPRALIIGGGIANFTDVAKTFTGIIRALREYKDKMKAAGIRIYVRRGGPNYQTGLKLMRGLGNELGIPIEVHGPEAQMTNIVPMAIDYVKGGA